jgi:peptide/nickel transport system substrate-binding protein
MGAAAAMVAAWPRSSSAQSDTPKRGGNLRIALTGSSTTATMDPHRVVVTADVCRNALTFESLTTVDNTGLVKNKLAESLESNSDGTEWTVRLRDVEFHNGKKLGPKDVIYTFQRITDAKNPAFGAGGLAPVDVDGMKMLDDRTVRIPMKSPFAIFPEIISNWYSYGIVPEDFSLDKPIGTGPFRLDSFAPADQSVHSRFDAYWGGPALLDKVTVVDSFKSENAAFAALQSGEVDAFGVAPLAIAKTIAASNDGPIKALVSEPALWLPFCMRVDMAPFNNPDVRQAMRLMIDREQFVNLAFSGFGTQANDLFSVGDPDFDTSLVRHRDLDQAKFLLKKAGMSDLAFELPTSELSNGMMAAAQVFARQASEAGVKVTVKQYTVDLYFQDYFPWPIGHDYWLYNPYFSQVNQSMLKSSPYNECRFDDPEYTALYNKMLTTVDPAKRTDIVHTMQKIEFDRGGYIIPAYNSSIDLVSSAVHGIERSRTGYSFGNYEFTKAWMS